MKSPHSNSNSKRKKQSYPLAHAIAELTEAQDKWHKAGWDSGGDDAMKEQDKRGKVVSRDEIANLIMFGFNSQPWSLVSTFENSGEVVNIATAIHKAVYGEGEDAVS
jgi:predicted transcriptional regulator